MSINVCPHVDCKAHITYNMLTSEEHNVDYYKGVIRELCHILSCRHLIRATPPKINYGKKRKRRTHHVASSPY